jgi:hypothetical protein
MFKLFIFHAGRGDRITLRQDADCFLLASQGDLLLRYVGMDETSQR